MSKTYHIGDLHFGHENIAKYRGFESSEVHDKTLIRNWNSIVSKNDKVFIHGDLSLGTSKYYDLLSTLNGLKHVILGNHDSYKSTSELLKYVDHVGGPHSYREFMLTHIPMHPSELRGKINIHAHTHERIIKEKGYFCVSADVINFTPISTSEIRKILKTHNP